MSQRKAKGSVAGMVAILLAGAMPSAPVALESASAAIQGDRIVISGGADPSGQHGDLILVYDIRQRTWSQLDAKAVVLTFAVSETRIVAVTRGNGNDIQVGQFRKGEPGEPRYAILRPDLQITGRIGVIDDGKSASIAGSDGTTTHLYRIDENGRQSRHKKLDATKFLPEPASGAKSAEISRTVTPGSLSTATRYTDSRLTRSPARADGNWTPASTRQLGSD